MSQSETPALEPADSPSYSRLTDADRITILKLADLGLTQVEIAQRLGRAQSTISDVLALYTDTTIEAKRYLRASAMRLATRLVEKGSPKTDVQALKGLAVLEEERSTGLVIQIGGTGHDVKVAVLHNSTPQVNLPSDKDLP